MRPATSRFKGRDTAGISSSDINTHFAAWAVTILGVEDLSFDRAVMDLGPDVLLHGQAHVALSRVRSMQGVMLVGLSRVSFRKHNPKVHEEYARLANCPIK